MTKVNYGYLEVRKIYKQARWKSSFRAQRIWYFGHTPAEAINAACDALAIHVGQMQDKRAGIQEIASPVPLPTHQSPIPALLGIEAES